MKLLGVVIEFDKLRDFHFRDYYLHNEADEIAEAKHYFLEGWFYGFMRGSLYGFFAGVMLVGCIRWLFG